MDNISDKLGEPETAPTRGEISTKLDNISDKLDEHETPTLRVHGERLANLLTGQKTMNEKLDKISEKLEVPRPSSPKH